MTPNQQISAAEWHLDHENNRRIERSQSYQAQEEILRTIFRDADIATESQLEANGIEIGYFEVRGVIEKVKHFSIVYRLCGDVLPAVRSIGEHNKFPKGRF